jgi:hypothetical protein
MENIYSIFRDKLLLLGEHVFMHNSSPCSNFSKKSVPGIASDVATRCVALERVPEGHWWWQRQWRTMPMVSNRFHRKNRSEVEREF